MSRSPCLEWEDGSGKCLKLQSNSGETITSAATLQLCMSDMDVQKTMEFILEQQAHIVATQAAMQAEHAVRMAEHAVQMAEHAARMAEIETVALKTDKRLDGLSKIVKFGMKVVLKQAESQKQTDERLNALIQVVDDLVRRRPN